MSRQPRGANGGMGGRRSGLRKGLLDAGHKCHPGVSHHPLFIQLGKLRHREGKRLTQDLKVSYVPEEKDDSSHSMFV